jgi:hypothetical protein
MTIKASTRPSDLGVPKNTAGRLSRLLAHAALLVVLLGSILGVLSKRIGPYDESALLLGARLVRDGKFPYVDFYTYYGPLGYSLLSPFLSLGNPGVAYRAAQAVALLALGALIFAVARRTGRSLLLAEILGAFCFIAFSSVIASPSFLGFLFVAASLALIALSSSREPAVCHLLPLGAGGMLAMAALVRPAFGIYAATGVFLFEALGSSRNRGRRLAGPSSWLLISGGAAISFSVLWAMLYRELSLQLTFYSTVVFPARLHRTGGRFLSPDFARAGSSPILSFLFSAAASAALFGLTIAWAYAVPRRRSGWLVVAASIIGGLLPLSLRVSRHPGRDSVIVSLALLTIVALVLFATRMAIRRSLLLRCSALSGITGAAFFHYFWARPDRGHVLPALALATAAAAFCFPRFRLPGRLVILALLLFEWHGVFRVTYPIAELAQRSTLSRLSVGMRSAEFPVDAIQAVLLADRYADPASRFVAVASSQAQTDGSAVVLFLISSRLPYTKWYSYDPGVQSSEVVQRMMAEELANSGSLTAVVWPLEEFVDGPPAPARTAFDRRFEELYPTEIARFGSYRVRIRRQ